jgi:hypothetical protein
VARYGPRPVVRDAVAVVVATHDRPDLLARTLPAMAAALAPGDELVVVGWDLGGAEGRRSYAGTALFSGDEALAWARATWFALPSCA